ncbi:MAG TPA: alpha/beta fold hydrolase [Pseudomonadales bacterium]|nr:alpha/beta fold hydrolase [Pseudomonadales bacterium]
MTESTNGAARPEDAALDSTLALNPVVGFGLDDVVKAGASVVRQALLQPAIGFEHANRLWQESVRIVFGGSDASPDPKDARFRDAAFADGFYKRLAQGWVAFERGMHEWVDAVGFEPVDNQRAHFLLGLIADGLAPTNFLLGNPSAIRRARETGGMSLVKGARNFVGDLLHNGGMPSQVDKTPFKVGENLANTPGSVVFRTPILELIQYKSRTTNVETRPVFIVPPQINKYYVYDLSPDKSLVRYLLDAGFQVFMVSWRSPRPEQRDWGLADYIDSIEAAIEATREITGHRAVSAVGACAGGITLTAALGYMAALGRADRVSSLTLMVNVLDTHPEDSVTGLFMTDEAIEAARKRSARQGVLDGNDTARVFNWMRPNDLIWNYVVSNYLHGETPPAFDILYWNNDTTRLPARLHSDFLDIFKDNPLRRPGALSIRGVPIDLKQIRCPVFITGGTTDHITPWQACYRSTQLFGSQATYVLSTAGHIQSLINPPGSSKRQYFLNPETPPDHEAWRRNAVEHKGSWWPYWTEWLKAHGVGENVAPNSLGSALHPPLADAPGSYVFE